MLYPRGIFGAVLKGDFGLAIRLLKAHCKLRKEAKKPGFFFIQIGANDGLNADPIHGFIKQYGWEGILVEPIKDSFEKLKDNYASHNNLIFVNKAIDDKRGERIMYLWEGKPGWSSFRAPDFYAEFDERTKIDVKKTKVKTISPKELLEEYSVNSVDLLQIDAEGYDFEILRMFPFDSLKPHIIQFEIGNRSRKDSELINRFLKEQGYTLIDLGHDAFAKLERYSKDY